MQLVPLQPVPNQVVNVSLGGQACTVRLYQREPAMFCDLYIGTTLVIGGVICQNINRIVRDAYLGFDGDLVFEDLQGDEDPQYSGLGTRWVLSYLTADEVAQAQA